MGMEPSSTRTWADGEVIFEQGDVGTEMYIVNSGRVEIYRTKGGQELKLATLGPGEYFGEMSLLLGEPRSASARAAGGAELSIIDRDTFMRLSVEHPVIWRLMTEMGERIQDVDSRLDDFVGRSVQASDVLDDVIGSRQTFI
jgi:CRP-like cAMP-binding protein